MTQPSRDDIDPKRKTGSKTESKTDGGTDDDTDRMAHAARQAVQRKHDALEEPEPSLGVRLGQIGILGWTIVVPTLLGLVIGHWLDRHFNTGVFFSAPLLMAGAAFGLWSAWKWMHRQTRRDRQ